MARIYKYLMAVITAFGLIACDLPRGAGLQSEVIKNSGAEIPEFAVYPVTKNFLPTVRNWPTTGGIAGSKWVPNRKGPIGRVILPGDTVQLAVWDSDENSLLTSPGQRVADLGTVTVAPNGTLFFPYIGQVTVGGLADTQAREAIQKSLEQVSPSAQVQLTSTAGARHTVNVVSGVASPGPISLEQRDMTVLAAISQRGGVAGSIKNPQVRLLRGNATYEMPLGELFKSPSKDTTLRSGDKIVVAETEKYFLGLGATGKEALVPFPKDHLSALDALTLIGGLSDLRANPKGVLILREYGSRSVRSDSNSGPSQKRVVFTMNLTSADGLFSAGKFQIMPKDLVYATESPINNTRTVLQIVGSLVPVARILDN